MPSLVPTLMILVRFKYYMNDKKEKISQKSVKREIKTGRKKIKHELHCGS